MSINQKTYTGTVSTDGTVAVTRVDGSALPRRDDPLKHASRGFSWGNRGADAAQLALALLADCLDDDGRAMAWHHEFKWYVVARLPVGRSWTLDEAYIRKIVDELNPGVRNRPM